MSFDRWQARHLPYSHRSGEKSSAAYPTLCLQLSGPLHSMGGNGNAHDLSGDSSSYWTITELLKYNGTQRSQVGRGAGLTAVKHKACNVWGDPSQLFQICFISEITIWKIQLSYHRHSRKGTLRTHTDIFTFVGVNFLFVAYRSMKLCYPLSWHHTVSLKCSAKAQAFPCFWGSRFLLAYLCAFVNGAQQQVGSDVLTGP